MALKLQKLCVGNYEELLDFIFIQLSFLLQRSACYTYIFAPFNF
jgi:hypothetical protein